MEDIEIAHSAKLNKINNITEKLNIPEDYVENYGKYKAKISIKLMDKIKSNSDGKLVLVTAINPTPLGEGKTTTSIGLSDALNLIGKKSILALREPSMGPVFGIKGGATGGGYSQVVPMEDINLHFTGDMHAITSANNLLSAMIDNHIYFGNELGFDKVTWRRCMDMNDRQLRKVTTGLSGEKRIVPRDDSFDITVASEIMAILCLATDLKDLERRLGNIVIGYKKDGEPITAHDLKADGAMAVILKDAINPNIVQTLEGNPAIIHGGPFANIAHGCNSIIATKMALKLGDYVVTEAGFGADLGAEKFINIKTRKLGKVPDAVVIVATLRALKYHGGSPKEECENPNEETLIKGLENLEKHINNIKEFGLNPIVAINRFPSDTDNELELVTNKIGEFANVSILTNYSDGSKGAKDLAEKVIETCDKPHNINYTYDLSDDIRTKIQKIATKIYGAQPEIEYSEEALDSIEKIDKLNLDYSICIAKTQYSFSDDPKNLLCEEPFKIHVKNVELKAGAEFILILTGKILTMPGLPKVPAAENIYLDENNNVVGLF